MPISPFKRLLDLFFVRKCIRCGKIVPYREPIALCSSCRPQINAYGQMVHRRGALSFAYSLLPYERMIRTSVRKLKYRNMKYLADTFAALMYESAVSEGLLDGIGLVTCVPMHRNRERHYNQAEAIARAFVGQSGIPGNFSLLKKIKDIPSFSGMTLAERQRYVRGAYAVDNRFDIRGKSVVIIDDTYTSGTTLGECAKLLRLYGAQRVIALTACYAVGRLAPSNETSNEKIPV